MQEKDIPTEQEKQKRDTLLREKIITNGHSHKWASEINPQNLYLRHQKYFDRAMAAAFENIRWLANVPVKSEIPQSINMQLSLSEVIHIVVRIKEIESKNDGIVYMWEVTTYIYNTISSMKKLRSRWTRREAGMILGCAEAALYPIQSRRLSFAYYNNSLIGYKLLEEDDMAIVRAAQAELIDEGKDDTPREI